jgi:ABC-type phosphate/phosphonate transport system substrate-binding protein
MRKYIVRLFILCIFTAADVQSAQEQPGGIYRIGVSAASFENLNRNDATAALKAWANTVLKEHNISEIPEVVLYDRFDELAQDYTQNRLHAISVSVEEYMRLKLSIPYVYVSATDHGHTARYTVVVRRDSGIHAIQELSGSKIALSQGQRMILARPWFEMLLIDSTNTNPAVKRDITLVENPSKAILQVFFRQCRAAVVTAEAFELACELNPQLQKELKMLAASPPFVPAVFLFPTNFQGTSRDKLEAAISQLHTTPGGRQVLTVFQSSRMDRVPSSTMDDTKQFLIQYYQKIQKRSIPGVQP